MVVIATNLNDFFNAQKLTVFTVHKLLIEMAQAY